MNILFIADAKSIWTKEFIDKIFLPMGASVSLQCDPGAQGKYFDYYLENQVEIIAPYKVSPLIMRIPKIRTRYCLFEKKHALAKYCGKFDKIIVLYVTPYALKCAKMLSNEKTDIYAAFIGSDILRITPKNTKQLISIMKSGKIKVVCESKQTGAMFTKKVGNKITLSPEIIYIGNSQLSYIDNWETKGITFCKEKFDIDPTKITICVGYNANSAQQHNKVIEQLGKLSDEQKRKICVLLPVAYGGTQEYLNIVKQCLIENGLTHRILTEYLNPSDVAALRVATDVFINAQTTDSLSASLKECFYAGATIISASWLEYRELTDWKLPYIKFSSFDEIGGIVTQYINNPSPRNTFAKETLQNHCSWNASKNNWERLLKQ